MTNNNQDNVDEYVRALQVRMLRHSFNHLPETFDPRTAMIIIRNGLLKEIPQSPIPEHVVSMVENPTHDARVPNSYGPFFLYRTSKSFGLLKLTTCLLNPDLRLRRAAMTEIDRQVELHFERHQRFLSPETHTRVSNLREALWSEEIHESLRASIEINDVLEDDYFYLLSGLRQSVEFQLKSDFLDLFTNLLEPSASTIQFLKDLPVSSPQQQQANIKHHRDRIAKELVSLSNVLNEYFRLFGHLPLAGDSSLAGVLASWSEVHGVPENAWDEIWKWVDENGSPLSIYHACQALCRNPSWIPEQQHQTLLVRIAAIVGGAEKSLQWKRRCDLARHYCRHLECIESGADGDRVAAFAWWLADSVCCVMGGDTETMGDILDRAFKISNEVWTVAHPAASLSSLRYATLFSRSIWATSILSEFFDSALVELVDQQSSDFDLLKQAITKLPYYPVGCIAPQSPLFAFESFATQFARYIPDSEHIHSTLHSARSHGGLESLIEELPTSSDQIVRIVAHELRLQSMCGSPPSKVLFEMVSNSDWRMKVLCKGKEEVVELICAALVEVSWRKSDEEWTTYLPHLFALACGESDDDERKRLLFAWTVVASLAMNSVSAVERLLKSDDRREYESYIENLRQRIETMTAIAPAWISAKLRGMKAVLHI